MAVTLLPVAQATKSRKTAAELARIISKGTIRRRMDRRPMREAMRWLNLITEIGSAVPPWVNDRALALLDKIRTRKGKSAYR